MKRICFFLSILIALQAAAQTPAFPTSGDIYLGIKKLNVLGSVLYLAAHPDDENTRLLTYFSKDKLYRTGYLSLTRGDGGQNLIGEEQGVELGLIRTQELLAARRIDGAEQFFSRAFDFGYSKSPEETFTKWDREKILSDVVWVVRRFQPDVIITRFPTTGEGGHGQHTASAILAVEAFRAAADPRRFPEQLQYVQPWQAKRILWNTFNFGGNNTTSPDQFQVDAGNFNPVLGKGYGEIAAESRSQHKSQGFGSLRGRGEAIEFFKPLGGDAPKNDLHDDVNTTWSKVLSGAMLDKVQAQVAEVIRRYDFAAPQLSVPLLLQLYQTLTSLPKSNAWAQQKAKEVKDLIVAASGLWVEAYTNTAFVAQGDSLPVQVVLNNRLGQALRLKKISGGIQPNDIVESFDSALQKNRNVVFVRKINVAGNAPLTQPYWLAEKMAEGSYNVTNQLLIGKPDVQPAATIDVAITLNGVALVLEQLPVRYKYNDQVRGELYQPLYVVPPYSLRIDPVVSISGRNDYQEMYTSYKDSITIAIPFSKNYHILLNKGQQRTILRKNGHTDTNMIVDPQNASQVLPAPHLDSTIYTDAKGNKLYDFIRIEYDHIPNIGYLKPSLHVLKTFDYKTAGKRIGYIVGAGDKVPEALEQMGYEVTLLTEKELERNNLQQFDAIIAGVRSFNANDWMGRYYNKLMTYVENGGNYIVQYSQSNNLRGRIGPYPFTVVNRRITNETAPVGFLLPQHPALNFPNKITQDDFRDWVQERSLYHAADWDSRFQPVLRMSDPGEQPHDGSLVVARHGKGYFTYTGLAFFRQLPAGVPGAYRLLANLIALNQQKGT